jgi:hypothetical protein
MSVPELVMNALLPLMTHWPSSSRAVVRVPPASLPAPGSVSRTRPAPRRRTASAATAASAPRAEAEDRHRAERHAASSVIATLWSTRPSSSSARHSAK